MIREAKYAGTWYPARKDEIEEFLDPKMKKTRAIACVCPHAGWLYSGKVAGEVYSSVEPARYYILIGPNHRGAGAPVSVYPRGAWKTPLGELEVAADVANAILDASRAARADMAAHGEEHSLEVQLPFIKYFSPEAKIVPIALTDYRPDTCRELGEAIAGALAEKRIAGDTLLVASTDMSHYVPADYAKNVDARAIDRILRRDPAGLLQTVTDEDITMCGSGPTAAVLWASDRLGAKETRLVRYATSGDITGDNNQVVGYAGLIIL